MKKHLYSGLIGLLSLLSVYVGIDNHQNKNDIIPVGIEGNVQIEDTENEVILEETKNKTETVTNPNKIDSVVRVSSEEALKDLYDELSNCDENTVYSKVIVNGKEYTDSDPKMILQDLINKYGVNLNKLNESPATKVPVETKPAETQAPVETSPPATEAPVETKPAATKAPVETKPVATKAPVETSPPEPQAPVETSPPATEAPKSFNNSYANEVLQLVNNERANHGLPALSGDSKLTSAANKRAVEIVSNFSHTRPNGTSCFTVFDEFGINSQTGGENIAYGQRTPSEVVTGWMNSEGHRANILSSKFGKLGVGVYEQNGVIYWTQLFTN